MNPLGFFKKLMSTHAKPESRAAETWALREIIFSGRKKKYRHFAKQLQTSAVAKRRRLRKIAHESRRRNRIAW